MEVTFRPTNGGWCKPSEGRKYAGNVSRKKFYSMLRNGLRHVRLPNGRILTKYDWIDAYLEAFEMQSTDEKAKNIADQLLEDF